MALTDGIKNKLKNIANAIRSKTNKSEELTLEQMASAIEELDMENYAKLAQESVAQLGLDEEKTNYVNSIITNYYTEQKENAKKFAVYNTNLEGHYGIVLMNYMPNDGYLGHKFTCDILLFNSNKLPNNGYDFVNFNIVILLQKITINNYRVCTFAACREVLGELTLASNSTYNALNMFQNYKAKKVPTINIPESNFYMNCQNMFSFSNIEELTDEITHFRSNVYSSSATCYGMFYKCSKLKKMLVPIKNYNYNLAFYCCLLLETIGEIDMIVTTNTTNMFQYCYKLKNANIINWKTLDINLTYSSDFSVESIDYNIENAIDKVDGATDRTLQLHATAGANWDANSKYQGEERKLLLTQKGIEVTW